MGNTEPGMLYITINDLLKERGISKSQLCKDLEITPASLERYCNNSIRMLDVKILCKICDYFDIEIDDLIKYIP